LILYEMDLSSGDKNKLLTLENIPDDLDRHGDIIVWSDSRNDPDPENYNDIRDIYLYDVENKIETQITSDAADQYRPVVHGDIIVWVDERNENEDIYAYDLTTDSDSNGVADYIDRGRKARAGGDGEDDDEIDVVIGMIFLASCAVILVLIIVGIMFLMDRKKKTAPPLQGPIQPGLFQTPYYQPGGPQYPGPSPPAQTPTQGYPTQSMPAQPGTTAPSTPGLPQPIIPGTITDQSVPGGYPGQHGALCPSCNGPARMISEHGRYYCDRCQRYLD